jgi:hypothetical protein
VASDPLNFLDLTGLICVPCIAQDSGGVGYKDGVKQCLYSCTLDSGITAEFPADSVDSNDGDYCEGTNVGTSFQNGSRTNVTNGLDSFSVDTESWVDKIIYSNDLIESIEKAFDYDGTTY